MSAPYAPPPQEVPDQVPANRRPGASPTRTLAVWLVLVVVCVAAYQLAGPSRPAMKVPENQAVPHASWPFALPVAAYGAAALVLVALRRRLPAKYRTYEQRIIPAATPETEAPAANPAPIAIDLKGSDLHRPVRLRIDGAGLHWRAEPRLLHPAQELEVGWDELESISTSRQTGQWRIWGAMLAVAGVLFLRTDAAVGGFGILVGAVVTAIGWKRTSGLLSFATATHTLTFASKELDEAAQDTILAAARERRPQAVPKTATQSGCLKAVYWLVLEPFHALATLARSDAALRAKLVAEGATFLDEETATAAILQKRMFIVWNGTLRGTGPFACALAAAAWGLGPAPFLTFGAAWVTGLLAMNRGNAWFARFTGMSIVGAAA